MPAQDPFAPYATDRGDILGQNAMQERIAAEIVTLTGCSQRVARCAAGSFVHFRNAPRFGLDPSASCDPGLAMDAARALDRWIEAKTMKAVA